MSLKEIIKTIDFFQNLTDTQLDELCSISSLIKYPENSILYYESESTNTLLFLISGLLKVYKVDKFDNEIFLYHIHKKAMISELTSLTNNQIFCFSNAEFTEDSEVLSINLEKFNELFLSRNILTMEFMNELLNKTHQLQCVINRELVFDATAKVAFMLNNDLEMFNKLKRQEVSFLLHIQPETLSRVLKRLTRNKIIEIETGKISILDYTQLTATFRGVAI